MSCSAIAILSTVKIQKNIISLNKSTLVWKLNPKGLSINSSVEGRREKVEHVDKSA